MAIKYFTVPADQHQAANIASAMQEGGITDDRVITVETVHNNVKVWYRDLFPTVVTVPLVHQRDSDTNFGLMTGGIVLTAQREAPIPDAEAVSLEVPYDADAVAAGIEAEASGIPLALRQLAPGTDTDASKNYGGKVPHGEGRFQQKKFPKR